MIKLLFEYSSALASGQWPTFPACDPETNVLSESSPEQPSSQFCAQWNPDFLYNGAQCCSSVAPRRHKKRYNLCGSIQPNGSYCDQMTHEQKSYLQNVQTKKISDPLQFLSRQMIAGQEQAYCTVNTGFLAFGRPVVPTERNRLLLRHPERCSNFGTDRMAALLEWVGREVSQKYSSPVYSKTHVLIGDISAPRGGCLCGSGGRKGHSSHTTGQDADIGFLTPFSGKESPSAFHTHFDGSTNWWFIKKIFKNPFVCIRIIFLDRRHIRTLSKVARRDPEWVIYRKYLKHMPGHKNHMHIRIGKASGNPGCNFDPQIDEVEDF